MASRQDAEMWVAYFAEMDVINRLGKLTAEGSTLMAHADTVEALNMLTGFAGGCIQAAKDFGGDDLVIDEGLAPGRDPLVPPGALTLREAPCFAEGAKLRRTPAR